MCDALPAFAPRGLAGNVSEAVLALVGYDAALGAVVVSFRGTVLGGGIPDARGTEPTSWGFDPGRGTVRRSSVRRYDSMRAALHPLVAQAVAAHPSAPVYLTGHSLGAGQSLIAAADLPAAFPRATFDVFAFAPYRQSDEAWNAAVSAQPNLARIWRINHRYDEVPAAYGRDAWSFESLGREVWYPNDDDDLYYVGDESGEDPRLL